MLNDRWVWLTAIVTLAIYYYFLSISKPFGFADEGYLYYLSWAMTEGKLPYQDFELISYPPGLFALHALFFKLMGDTVTTGRIVAVLFMIANTLLSFCLVRRIAGRFYGLLAAIIIGHMPGPWHKAYIGFLCLSSLLLAIRIHVHKSGKDFLLMGGLIALGLQLRIDAAISASVLLGVASWRITPLPVLFRLWSLTVLAVILTMLPLSLYLGAYGLLDDYFWQLTRFFGIATDRNLAWYRLPAPSLANLLNSNGDIAFAWLYYSSFLIPISMTGMAVWSCLAHQGQSPANSGVALLVALAILMCIPQYAIERPDAAHLYQRGFALIIGICFLMGENGLSTVSRLLRPASTGLILLPILGLYLWYGISTGTGAGINLQSPQTKTISLPSGQEFRDSISAHWGKLAMYIANNTSPGDTLAAIPYAPGLNFVLKRHLPGRRIFYFPNNILTVNDDAGAAADLAVARYIVLQPDLKLAPTAQASLACYAPRISALINTEFQSHPDFNDPLLLMHKISPTSSEIFNIPPCASTNSRP